ncbi:MAG: transcriptional regulator [Planctomycetaceae bacterium]|nr:transcriptional regulator [Planctomycetaceae bacterium]
MEKSPFTREHRVLVGLLRTRREEAGLTQEELARRLKVSQSSLSKWERGDRRIDLVQLRSWCQATGCSLAEFINQFEKRLARR